MSLLQQGRLDGDWYENVTQDKAFRRTESTFRNWITPDGSPGPTGEGGFPAAPGRYHLYVSLACPWAHRTLIVRALKGLEEVISVDIVNPHMGPEGWNFETVPGATGDRVNGKAFLHEIYTRADPGFSGIVTVPVLWDKHRRTIVNNESSEIIRMFNSAFEPWARRKVDLVPESLRAAIDELNAVIYDDVNNGVYKAGFARDQAAYEAAYDALFARLDELDARLASRRFLLGDTPTEADWRLFPTLVRFDPVYVAHFKCNRQRIADYPHLSGYLRDLYQWPGIADTVNLAHIKTHYFTSHPALNPSGIVPKGPELDWLAPHGREALS